MTAAMISRFRAARRDPSLAVLEGFHALKHGVRFGAEFELVVATDLALVEQLASRLAPGLRLPAAELASPDVFAQLAPHAHRTGVIAIARRPVIDLAALLAAGDPRPLVLLEDPRTMGNMGACVRVAAAAGAGAVLTTGTHDPWHADALRGSAGLHYALPVTRLNALPPAGRPLLALDPEGEPLDPAAIPPRAILAFGTERDGLSDALLQRADARLALPMEPGVSSLNLATSVAAVLYAVRLAR